jgi:hypothetical protein
LIQQGNTLSTLGMTPGVMLCQRIIQIQPHFANPPTIAKTQPGISPAPSPPIEKRGRTFPFYQ